MHLDRMGHIDNNGPLAWVMMAWTSYLPYWTRASCNASLLKSA